MSGKQQGTSNFKNMSIFPFCNPVLLRCVNTRTLMYNTIFLKVSAQGVIKILCTIISTKNLNFGVKLSWYHIVKVHED